MTFRLFVAAGEASGDRHAAALVRELRKRVSGLEVRGLGGRRLEDEGAVLLERTENLSVLGFAEVARRLPFFLRLYRRVISEIETWKPDIVLPVDYPGFNLRLGRAARTRGFRVIYYIAPQVWAWRRDRRPGVRRAVDDLLVVFPFETPLFEEAGIQTTFVGHPLLDESPPTPPAVVRSRYGLGETDPLLALLPGSRPQEIRHILDPLVAGARPLEKEGVRVVVSRAPGVDEALYRPALEAGLTLWSEDAASLARAADAALVASGTATLETGLLGTPLAVVYRTGPLNWHLARLLIKLRTVGLVNIAAGGDLVPELLQNDLTADRVEGAARRLLFDGQCREKQKVYLSGLRDRLGGHGAVARAAGAVAEQLGGAES